MIAKLKSKLLTYLFQDWVKNEYDLETLELTKGMIHNREVMLKTIIDKVNHKPIIGFIILNKKTNKIFGYMKNFSYIYYVNK